MHRLDNLKYREIAEKLDISQSAVEKHIARAALALTEWMEGW
jgi:RNA polymerase sigma-70 factor (ECF subfamily)